MSRTVRITLELDGQAVRLLDANIGLGGGLAVGHDREIDVRHALALLVLMEARGAHHCQIDAAIPEAWKECMRVVGSERRVYDRPIHEGGQEIVSTQAQEDFP